MGALGAGRELCGCDVTVLLTYCLVPLEPGKPRGGNSSSPAPVQPHWAPGWDMGAVAAGRGSSLETSGLWLLQRRFVPAQSGFYIHELWPGMVGGAQGDSFSMTPFLLQLSQPHLELAARCCRGAELVGWGCVFTGWSCSAGISSWGHLASRKGNLGARQPHSGGLDEWDAT